MENRNDGRQSTSYITSLSGMHSDIKQDFDKLQPFLQAQRNEGLNEKKKNDTTETIKTNNQFLNFTMLHKNQQNTTGKYEFHRFFTSTSVQKDSTTTEVKLFGRLC